MKRASELNARLKKLYHQHISQWCVVVKYSYKFFFLKTKIYLRVGKENMQTNNSELHNSNQKLVLHMWQEDSGDENPTSHHNNNSPENRKSSKQHIHKDSHRQHRHRNRHRHGGGGGSGHHRDSHEDRIEVYVQKKPTLKGPPTKPKPNISEMARRAHSSHSKQCFLLTSKEKCIII